MNEGSESSGPEVICLGSALVDEEYLLSNLPGPDGGAYVKERAESFGGVGANAAVALSRYGRGVGMITRVGEDERGERVVENLALEGVGTRGISHGPEPSTYCMVFRDDTGERFIITGGESTRNLRLDDGDHERLRSADLVVANAYCPDRVSRDLADLARSGVPASFDLTGPIAELEDRGTERETLDALLPGLSLFVCGGVAAESYLGVRGREAVDALRERGVERGAFTRGEEGAILWEGDCVTSIPAFEVDVVDTTGAGDAFHAALVHRWLLGGREMAEAGRFAAAAGALNCTTEGARGGLASEDEVEAFLAERTT
ncbi:carbohydrate kinase family protein [Natronorarus salvus]|uniref:carbohydrate kinase family protein n=1 Tax=Natronorarus salvus TaxID=3117733 RepID=UPI002F26CC38